MNKTIELSRKDNFIQVLILPKRVDSDWFSMIKESSDVAILELKRNLFFSNGPENLIFKQASFKSILVFIGLSFAYITVENNAIGNFTIIGKWFYQVFNVYKPINFVKNKTGLKTHLTDIVSCVSKCEEIMNEFFSPMNLGRIETNVTPINIFDEIVGNNCMGWFNIARIHPWLNERFLKFTNAQKPIVYMRAEARLANDKALKERKTMRCSTCNNATHNTMACYNREIYFSKFQNVEEFMDIV